MSASRSPSLSLSLAVFFGLPRSLWSHTRKWFFHCCCCATSCRLLLWVSVVASRAANNPQKWKRNKENLWFYDITAFCLLLLIDKIDVRLVSVVAVADVAVVVADVVAVAVCWLVSSRVLITAKVFFLALGTNFTLLWQFLCEFFSKNFYGESWRRLKCL